jgi:hypothetical protein
MKTFVLLAILMLPLPIYRQSKPSPTAPKAEIENVYYHQSWDDGEVKDCLTYSGGSHLLACDIDNVDWEDSFLNLVARNSGPSKVDAHGFHSAFVYSMTHSKKFPVRFPAEACPKPQEGTKMTFWKCTKEKSVTCKFAGKEK